MRVEILVSLIVALVCVPTAAVERYHVEGARVHRHRRQNPEAGVQILTQEDEAVTSPTQVQTAMPAAAVQPVVNNIAAGAVTMSCQDINGKTICMPAASIVNEAPKLAAEAAPVAAVPMVDPLVATLEKKLKEKEVAAETSTELAKEMVNEVRFQSKELVEQAQAEAKVAREENDQLRLHIIDLEDRLAAAEAQLGTARPVTNAAPVATTTEPTQFAYVTEAPIQAQAQVAPVSTETQTEAVPAQPAFAAQPDVVAQQPSVMEQVTQPAVVAQPVVMEQAPMEQAPVAQTAQAAEPQPVMQQTMEEYNKLKAEYEALM